MKTIIVCLALSLFALVSPSPAGDDKAPTTKPAAATEKAKAAPAPAAVSSTDCCGTDTGCKMPVRKVAMSPKAAALLATK